MKRNTMRNGLVTSVAGLVTLTLGAVLYGRAQGIGTVLVLAGLGCILVAARVRRSSVADTDRAPRPWLDPTAGVPQPQAHLAVHAARARDIGQRPLTA